MVFGVLPIENYRYFDVHDITRIEYLILNQFACLTIFLGIQPGFFLEASLLPVKLILEKY